MMKKWIIAGTLYVLCGGLFFPFYIGMFEYKSIMTAAPSYLLLGVVGAFILFLFLIGGDDE